MDSDDKGGKMSNEIENKSKVSIEFKPLICEYARKNQLLGRQKIVYDNSINQKQEIFETMKMMEADLLVLYKEIVDYVSQLPCENTCNE